MIVVENLSVSYGAVRALQSVSFEAPSGEITAVLGANGAGKTTLLRTISGLVTPLSGTVRKDGDLLSGRKTEDIVRLGVAHVPEGRGVIAEFTVEENLRLGFMIARGSLADALDEQYAIFPVLGERRRQAAATLSGGERQISTRLRATSA